MSKSKYIFPVCVELMLQTQRRTRLVFAQIKAIACIVHKMYREKETKQNSEINKKNGIVECTCTVYTH